MSLTTVLLAIMLAAMVGLIAVTALNQINAPQEPAVKVSPSSCVMLVFKPGSLTPELVDSLAKELSRPTAMNPDTLRAILMKLCDFQIEDCYIDDLSIHPIRR